MPPGLFARDIQLHVLQAHLQGRHVNAAPSALLAAGIHLALHLQLRRTQHHAAASLQRPLGCHHHPATVRLQQLPAAGQHHLAAGTLNPAGLDRAFVGQRLVCKHLDAPTLITIGTDASGVGEGTGRDLDVAALAALRALVLPG